MSGSETGKRLTLRPMRLSDLAEVEALDRQSFPKPWPRDAFRYELTRNQKSVCWVAEWKDQDKEPILVGSIVVWVVVDEAHIATLAVKPGYRRRGIAKRLLARALLESVQQGACKATLEVRVGNWAARALYEEFGFEIVGVRRGYYQANKEDALLMSLMEFDHKQLESLGNKGC